MSTTERSRVELSACGGGGDWPQRSHHGPRREPACYDGGAMMASVGQESPTEQGGRFALLPRSILPYPDPGEVKTDSTEG